MLASFHKWLNHQSPAFNGLAAIILITLVGGLDFFTGYELSFAFFYLIPVVFAGWYLGRMSSYLLSVLSAVTWSAIDYYSGLEYSSVFLPFWNALTRLGFFIVVSELVSRLKEALEYQEVLAESDGLTGLFNARAFREKSDIHFQLSSRNNHAITLAYIDLDGFKGINDSLGHSMGDRVLQKVSEQLWNSLRASDICARLGGDEFSVLLPETDLAGAKSFFTRLHANLCQLAEENAWPIGFSIGVAVFQPVNIELEQAISLADGLMYEIKKTGKNNVRYQVF